MAAPADPASDSPETGPKADAAPWAPWLALGWITCLVLILLASWFGLEDLRAALEVESFLR